MMRDALRHQLLARRNKLESILRNIDIQRLDLLRRNPERERGAGRGPVSLLDSLDGWYHKELNDIDQALARTEENGYGRCLGCNTTIDSEWLQHFPETEYCRGCEELKKWMSLG